MKGFFKRIKKSIVQRKPPFKQTDAQTRRKSLYRPEDKEEWRIDTKFDDNDIDLYSEYGNLQQYSRSDDAPTIPVSDDLDAHDDAPKEPASGASNDDDCSFRKEDNLKLYEETRLWCKMDRKEAEEQLLIPDTPSGTFLIRESREGNSLVLSIRDFDPKTNNAYVRHYRICRTKNGGFYITPKRPFDNMLDLIFHYRSNVTDLLYDKLKIPDTVIQPLVEFRELEVSRESVKLLKKLGSGSFAEFYLSNLLNTVDVAVKTLKQGQMTADDFMAEAKLMHHLRHNKLVQLMAVCTKSEPIYIITELMINGTLIDYLRYDKGRTIDFNLLAYMAGQIADGMAYMETKNYVHRNLRATNILVGDHNKVKVAGFRLARSIHESFDDAHGHTKLPTKWTAPEAAFYRKFSIKSDVWSYGVLLYELITFGSDPYAGMNGLVVLKRLEAGFRMDKPEPYYIPCPDPYYEIMLKCWNSIADSRPTFAFLQDYFNNYMIYAEEMQFISQYTREQTRHSDDTRKLGATGGCVDDYEAETRLDPQQSMQVSSPQIYESVPNAVTTEQTHRGSNTDKLGITSGFSVKALYDYEAGADDEISLYTDDIITNVDPANEYWWMGTTTNGTRGLFPSNYVEIFESAYAEVTKH
ncbi:tyrosine-protein kinase SRK2-like [Mercenaria mercenaria]|uniref:tyrosine-protein kinase SRK2-like n=1 Tax=Mercenaria mercenaria TaxID=6596 RepID=UPI00234F9361|nr:tyrosine-protein kinase SRK2-like [Mercenaria mercenaria]